MILVSDLFQLGQDATAHIEGLNSSIVVVEESHFRKRLGAMKESDFPTLVAVMPSAQSNARDVDNIKWNNRLMFFILKRINYSNRTYEQELTDFQVSQIITQKFFDYLIQRKLQYDSCNPLRELDPDRVLIDPEYNFLSCDGHSISFQLEKNHSEWTQSTKLLPTTFTWGSEEF
ncbi:MAG: hypothetical protein LAT81_16180 [Oceanicaulis sp.]|nr:hypothetical protein [Oceanicaulis sp.]